MRGWARHLRAAREATEPSPDAVLRLQDRASAPGQLLRAAAVEPRPGAIERLKQTAPRRRPLRWLRLTPIPLVAAVAFVTLWALRPPPPLSELLSATIPTERRLTEALRLDYEGSGAVEGVELAPHIRWEVGRLGVELEPHRGVALTVETDEGEVAVLGTAFSVTRDALGTRVAVTRGRVRVSCREAAPIELGAGDEVECLPLRAAGWLGRAQALNRAGRPLEDVREAIDRGLNLATPGDPVAGELVALRIYALLQAGLYPEALSAAEAYLASGAAPRRAEVEALAAELRARP